MILLEYHLVGIQYDSLNSKAASSKLFLFRNLFIIKSCTPP